MADPADGCKDAIMILGPGIGAVIALGGIWFKSYLDSENNEKEKRAEILNNLSQAVTLYYDSLAMMLNSENMKLFSQFEIIFGHPKFETLNKEIALKSLDELFAANRDLVKMKAEIQRLFSSFSRHFFRDDVLKNLINDFLKKPMLSPILKPYESARNRDELIIVQKENVEIIAKIVNVEIQPKKLKLISYLGGIDYKTKNNNTQVASPPGHA